MWRQHKFLPQSEPNFRHLLDCTRVPAAALFLAHFTVHFVKDGDDVLIPET